MIGSINVGGTDTSDATALASDILKGKTAYVNDEKITGTMEKGDFINGIIKEAKAQGIVTAGDFVTFINKSAGLNAGTDTQLSSYTYTGQYISAIEVSQNKVCVFYTKNTTQGSTIIHNIYALICIIDGTTITLGNEKTIVSDDSYTIGQVMSTVKLIDNKIFIAYSHKGNSNVNEQLYGIVCNVSRNNNRKRSCNSNKCNSKFRNSYLSSKINRYKSIYSSF